jgi:hypothetical protein
MQADNVAIDSVEESEQEESKRDRSKIQFPYSSLDEAIVAAKGVQSVGGSSCKVEQLAAHLKLKSTDSAFRGKLGAARIFGLITNAQGTVTLTSLGNRICDPAQEAAAKAEAFLTVPLYQKIYDQFKTSTLPPFSGLEGAIVTMGVAPKQKATARQVFQRSATTAGFFWSGTDRLVYPPIKAGAIPPAANSAPDMPPPPEGSGEKPAGRSGNGGEGGGGQGLHPLIEGLIKTLPPQDKPWPIEKRVKWLRAAAQNFEIIYPDMDETAWIEVKIQKGAAE